MAQLWGTPNLGGYMYSDRLSNRLRQELKGTMLFRQFADIKDFVHQGLFAGDTYNWNMYGGVATQGGQLTEGTPIPNTEGSVTPFSGTMTEWGNSINFTGKLQSLAEHPVREVIKKWMRDDVMNVMDRAVADEFNKTQLRVAPVGGNSTTALVVTEGPATPITNNAPLGKQHVKLISDEMKERNIPSFRGGDYYCLTRPRNLRAFKDDLELIKQYTDTGFGEIRSGEIGRYESVRFIEQTNVERGVVSAKGTAWDNGGDWACFFGADTVAEAIAIPEELRAMIPDDYGRSRGLAWYAILGFSITRPTGPQATIMIWDSAA